MVVPAGDSVDAGWFVGRGVVEDPAALAAAVLDTLAEPERARQRTAQGREHVAREFEPVRVARRFREVLDEAVREARG